MRIGAEEGKTLISNQGGLVWTQNPGKRGLSEPQHVPVLLPSNQGWSSKGDADPQTMKKLPRSRDRLKKGRWEKKQPE